MSTAGETVWSKQIASHRYYSCRKIYEPFNKNTPLYHVCIEPATDNPYAVKLAIDGRIPTVFDQHILSFKLRTPVIIHRDTAKKDVA